MRGGGVRGGGVRDEDVRDEDVEAAVHTYTHLHLLFVPLEGCNLLS